MELLATIGLSSATAGATAATVGSAAAAGTTSAALLAAPVASAAGFSAASAGAGLSLSTLGTGLSLASGVMSLFSGDGQADAIMDQTMARTRALEMQTVDERIAAKQEELAAKESGNTILDNLRRTMGSQQLAFSANGVDGDFGSGAAVSENAMSAAGSDLSLTREDAYMRISARRRRATELARERGMIMASGSGSALDARRSGMISAVGSVANTLERRVRRG